MCTARVMVCVCRHVQRGVQGLSLQMCENSAGAWRSDTSAAGCLSQQMLCLLLCVCPDGLSLRTHLIRLVSSSSDRGLCGRLGPGRALRSEFTGDVMVCGKQWGILVCAV